jgi:polysaccharide export outer membrane protein
MTGRGDFTVMQAVSMAEGLDKTAAPKKAHILRRSGNSSRVEIPVNLETVMSGKAPDMALKADDVLFVPNNTAKSAGMKTLDTVIQLTTGIVVYGRY